MKNIDYSKYKPFIGDTRWNNLKNKYALDHLRVKYYEAYGKDPSITYLIKDEIMFSDFTLPIVGSCYLIRGSFSFKVYFQSNYKDTLPSNNYTITIKVEKDQLNDMNIAFISNIINYFSGEKINLVVGDCYDKEYRFSFIDSKEVKKDKKLNEHGYLYFFERLCDNNTRNILYIGKSLQDGVKQEEIDKVNNDYVNKHFYDVLTYAKITQEELEKSNEYIRTRIGSR